MHDQEILCSLWAYQKICSPNSYDVQLSMPRLVSQNAPCEEEQWQSALCDTESGHQQQFGWRYQHVNDLGEGRYWVFPRHPSPLCVTRPTHPPPYALGYTPSL